MSSRRLVNTGTLQEADIGFSRAVVSGPFIFVSGTTGMDHPTYGNNSNVEVQCDQAFQNIDAALKAAGAGMKDVVRVNYLFADCRDFEKCWPTFRKWLGDIKPAATMAQVGLMDEDVKIEIEVTAHVLG